MRIYIMSINSSKSSVYDYNKSVTIETSEINEIIRNDDHEGLQRLLKENLIDVNMPLASQNGTDHSLLTIACTMESVGCVRLLLDTGLDINILMTSSYNERNKLASTFTRACASGSTKLFWLLIDRGVKLDDSILFRCFDSVEKSTLQADKRQAIVAVLVKLISNIAFKAHGHTFLHRVCSIGGINNAKALLEGGVDRDAISDSLYGLSGRDALGVAAINGHVDIVELLLEWDKINPVEKDRVNKAMVEAAKHGKIKVVHFLTEHGADCQTEALIAAVSYTWSLALSEYLIDNGADINGMVDGYTPLLALLSNTRTGDEVKLQIARLLLARGADCDAKACLTHHSDYDSLILAAKYGLPDFLQMILEHRQVQPITINRLNDALFHSIGHSVRSTECLLDYGAAVNATGTDGCTPLLLLCNKHSLGYMSEGYSDDYLSTVQLLLERGADTSLVCPVSGNTALLYACKFSVGLKLSTLLLEHGADVNQGHATTGETPLMRAVQTKDMAMVKLYLRFGADVMQVTSKGLTVLDLMHRNRPEYDQYVELCLEHGDVKPLLK